MHPVTRLLNLVNCNPFLTIIFLYHFSEETIIFSDEKYLLIDGNDPSIPVDESVPKEKRSSIPVHLFQLSKIMGSREEK